MLFPDSQIDNFMAQKRLEKFSHVFVAQSCVPEVSGGGSKVVYVWYECVCASEFTRAGIQNVHFSQHWFYNLLLDDKNSNHQRGYARCSLQTRGCVWMHCMSGCVHGDARWSASSAPVDSHSLPPSSAAQSRTHTSQLSAVNSGDRRKTSYPPWPALLCSITLLRSRESGWG